MASQGGERPGTLDDMEAMKDTNSQAHKGRQLGTLWAAGTTCVQEKQWTKLNQVLSTLYLKGNLRTELAPA